MSDYLNPNPVVSYESSDVSTNLFPLYERGVKDTTNPKYPTLRQIAAHIRNPDATEAAIYARVADAYSPTLPKAEQETYKTLKNALPSVSFSLVSATGKRSDKAATGLTGFVMTDWDGFATKEEAIAFKELISKDKSVVMAFISPSHFGVKALVYTDVAQTSGAFDAIKPTYTNASQQVMHAFSLKYEMECDVCCSDISRACFLSHDPSIRVNYAATKFVLAAHPLPTPEPPKSPKPPKSPAAPSSPDDTPKQPSGNSDDQKQKRAGVGALTIPLSDVAAYIKRNNISMVDAYTDFALVCSEMYHNANPGELHKILDDICSVSAGYTADGVYKKLQQLKDSPMGACKLNHFAGLCSANNIALSFASKKHKAEYDKAVKAGGPTDKYFSLAARTEDRSDIAAEFDAEEIRGFWKVRGGYQFYDTFTKRALAEAGIYIHEGNIVRLKNGALTRFDGKPSEVLVQMSDAVREYHNPIVGPAVVESFIKRELSTVAVHRFLSSVPKRVLRSDKKRQYLAFEDCVVSVTAVGATVKSYAELSELGYAAFVDINRKYDAQNVGGRCFAKFVENTQDGDTVRTLKLKKAIGYLLHGYRTPQDRIVFLVDAVQTLNGWRADGGRGKSLVSLFVKQFAPVLQIDGRVADLASRFLFDGYRPGQRVASIEDPPAGFSMGILYNVVTGDFTYERKGENKVTVQYEDGLKLVISTNYLPSMPDKSSKGRSIAIEFGVHYGRGLSGPDTEFGYRFFSSEECWSDVNDFAIECLQIWLSDMKWQDDETIEKLSLKRTEIFLDSEVSELLASKMSVDVPVGKTEIKRWLQLLGGEYHAHSTHKVLRLVEDYATTIGCTVEEKKVRDLHCYILHQKVWVS